MVCKCIEQVNEQLREHNTELVLVQSLGMTPGKMTFETHLAIATRRIEALRDGKKAKMVVAAYCPFCGKTLAKKPKHKAARAAGGGE